MSKQYSIAEARNHFTAIVRDVERESTVELTRRGKPVAVLLSVQEYKRLSSGKGGFWQAFTAFRNRVNLQELGIEPNIFTGLRDQSPGREIAL
jgi:prevent-host-death family protein